MVGDVVAPNILVIGASSGIGFGFARALASRIEVGRVYASYRRDSAVLKDAQEESEKLSLVHIDVCAEQTLEQVAEKIRAEVGKLHLILYCAGILHCEEFGPEKHVRDLTTAPLMRSFQVNSVGAVLCARYFRDLLKHEDRSIMAALSARVGSINDNRAGGWYGYRASKAALNMFFKTLAIEYARTHPNCAVVLLHPGTTDTPLSKPFQQNVRRENLFPVDKSVGHLLNVLEGITPADSGNFFAWDGTKIPW